jgi:hypothetical protein
MEKTIKRAASIFYRLCARYELTDLPAFGQSGVIDGGTLQWRNVSFTLLQRQLYDRFKGTKTRLNLFRLPKQCYIDGSNPPPIRKVFSKQSPSKSISPTTPLVHGIFSYNTAEKPK